MPPEVSHLSMARGSVSEIISLEIWNGDYILKKIIGGWWKA